VIIRISQLNVPPLIMNKGTRGLGVELADAESIPKAEPMEESEPHG
jgi:hypothetical protein